MKKKRILHTPPPEVQAAEQERQRKLNDWREIYREECKERRREQIRNMKMPAHPPRQYRELYCEWKSYFPPYGEDYQKRVEKLQKRDRIREYKKKAAKRLKKLHKISSPDAQKIRDEESNAPPHVQERRRDFNEQSISRTTPIHDILSHLDEKLLPP